MKKLLLLTLVLGNVSSFSAETCIVDVSPSKGKLARVLKRAVRNTGAEVLKSKSKMPSFGVKADSGADVMRYDVFGRPAGLQDGMVVRIITSDMDWQQSSRVLKTEVVLSNDLRDVERLAERMIDKQCNELKE